MPVIECAENKPLSGSVTDGKVHVQGQSQETCLIVRLMKNNSVTGIWQKKFLNHKDEVSSCCVHRADVCYGQ